MPDRTQRPEGDAKSQIDRFRETARELGCDEDEAAFRDKLRVIARREPKAGPISPAKSAPRKKTD
jgi:hypothetical protein